MPGLPDCSSTSSVVERSRKSWLRRNWYSRVGPPASSKTWFLRSTISMSASRKLSAGLRSPGGALDAETQGAAAGRVGRQLELDRQHFAVAAEGDLPAFEHVAGAALRAPAASPAGGPRQDLHRDRLARHALGLHVAGHRVMIAGIGAGRHGQIADGHVGRLAVGAEPDGEDGNLGFLGQLDGGIGRDAGVLAAVAEDDDARDGRAALRPGSTAAGPGRAAFRCRWAPAVWPNRAERLSEALQSPIGTGLSLATALASRMTAHDFSAAACRASPRGRASESSLNSKTATSCVLRSRARKSDSVSAQHLPGSRSGAVAPDYGLEVWRSARSAPCSGWYRPAATPGSFAPPPARTANAAASRGSAGRRRPPFAGRSSSQPSTGRNSTASRRYI